jgi:hypothetical protein
MQPTLILSYHICAKAFNYIQHRAWRGVWHTSQCTAASSVTSHQPRDAIKASHLPADNMQHDACVTAATLPQLRASSTPAATTLPRMQQPPCNVLCLTLLLLCCTGQCKESTEPSLLMHGPTGHWALGTVILSPCTVQLPCRKYPGTMVRKSTTRCSEQAQDLLLLLGHSSLGQVQMPQDRVPDLRR